MLSARKIRCEFKVSLHLPQSVNNSMVPCIIYILRNTECSVGIIPLPSSVPECWGGVFFPPSSVFSGVTSQKGCGRRCWTIAFPWGFTSVDAGHGWLYFLRKPAWPWLQCSFESHPCLPWQPGFHLPFHALTLSAVPFSPDASNKTDAGGKEYAGDEKSSLQIQS